MKTHTVLLFSLIFTGPALAQPETSAATAPTNATSTSNLDLTPPELPIQYRADPTASNTVPPGTYYGDTSGITAAITDKRNIGLVGQHTCEGKLSGAVSTGVGYTNRGGNNHWQAANLNTCKTYYDDAGAAHRVGISLSVGQTKGPHYYSLWFHKPHPAW